jgi:beta-glucanase (GH16 family)
MTDRTDDLFDENTAWITYHWPDALGRNLQVGGRFPGPDNYTQGFHVFAMEWEPGEIRWYIDGAEKMRVDGPTVSTVPMFLIYSLQIGHADWIGADADPNAATPFPSYLDADYVRVYQR